MLFVRRSIVLLFSLFAMVHVCGSNTKAYLNCFYFQTVLFHRINFIENETFLIIIYMPHYYFLTTTL